jgi:hypothetical protein
MALTKTPIELSSTPGIVDNSNATAITIDSSENVGLGVTPEAWHSVFKVLRVGTGSSIAGESGGTSTWFNTNAYYDGSWKRINQNTSAQIAHTSDGKQEFKVAASGSANSAISWNTAMTVDNSGNLLVGKTATDNTTAGTRIHPAGYASFTIANDYPIIANRLSSDGDIAVFRKDGTTVGSIQSRSGLVSTIILDPRTNGVGLTGTATAVIPTNNTGVLSNAAMDIGGSGYAFKDLYLSGNVNATNTYLGNGNEIGWGGAYSQGKPTISGYNSELNFYSAGSTSGLVMKLTSGGSLVVGGSAAGSLSGNDAMITVRRDSGNCGISYQSGTAATDQWETYTNLGARFYIENTSTSNGAYLVYNSSSGWVSISDERWKTDWTSLEDSSSKIAALNVGKYHMLNNSKESIEGAKWDYGVKAQELLEVIPDAVDVPENPDDKYGVVPDIVFWHAVKAIQEQQTLIESLTDRIAALEE